MTFKDFAKNTILRMDLLSASPTFRVRKQSQYETIVGGLLSFLTMAIFGYILGLQLVYMFNYESITYSQGFADDISSQTSISDLKFAVSIQNVDLSINPKQFMFFLYQVTFSNSGKGRQQKKIPVMLSPCKIEDWQDLGTNFQKQFTVFGFGQLLCIDSNASYELSGYIGSINYKYLTFEIQMCNQTIDSQCDSPQNITEAISTHINRFDYYKVKFYVIDTIITGDNKDAITKVLQKNIFLSFTNTIGTVGYLNMAQYTIQTDQSPWPVTQYTSQTGSFIQGFQTNSVSISSTKYISFSIYKSTKSLTVTRTIGKIDQVLSYVGGLFGLLFTGIAFFVASYSGYCYEIYVAESMLVVDNKGKKIKQKDFNFLTYVAYAIYSWLQTFNLAPTKYFKNLSEINEVRQEACELLDPILILKRIKYLQDVSKVLLSEHKQMCCYLSEPLTLQQARRMRNTLMFYDKVMEQMHQNQQIEQNNEQNRNTNNNYYISKDQHISKRQSNQKILSNQKIQLEYPIQQEHQMTEEEEEQMLIKIMKESLQKLQSDDSESAIKINKKVPKRMMEWLKKQNKQKQSQMVIHQNEILLWPSNKAIINYQAETKINLQKNKK